jgi:hypothetical protein
LQGRTEIELVALQSILDGIELCPFVLRLIPDQSPVGRKPIVTRLIVQYAIDDIVRQILFGGEVLKTVLLIVITADATAFGTEP